MGAKKRIRAFKDFTYETPHRVTIRRYSFNLFHAFEGTASVVNDEARRDGIYRAMHPIERKFDSKILGTAIIIKLDKVTIRTKSGSNISVGN